MMKRISRCVHGGTLMLFSGLLLGCVAPQARTGELFVATKRQFDFRNYRIWMGTVYGYNTWVHFCGGIVGLTYSPFVDLMCIPHDLKLARTGQSIVVVDNEGVPVPDVFVCFSFSGTPDYVSGRTDSNGLFETHRDLGAFPIRAYDLSGEGYYRGYWCEGPHPDAQGVQRSLMGGEKNVRLKIKKISRPVEMTYGRLVIPRERKDALVFEYDCELAEWLPPFGWGRHADLRVERSRKDSEGLRTVSITALGRGNGFCHRKYDLGSELGSDFRVPEGTDFPQTEIVWRQIYDGMLNYLGEVDGPVMHDYFIMRLRSEVDERGRVVRARYGKMVFVGGPLAQTYLNVIPNEKSLEAKTRIRPLVESDGVKRFGGETVWRP